MTLMSWLLATNRIQHNITYFLMVVTDAVRTISTKSAHNFSNKEISVGQSNDCFMD